MVHLKLETLNLSILRSVMVKVLRTFMMSARHLILLLPNQTISPVKTQMKNPTNGQLH